MSLTPKDNYLRAITFSNPDHIPYEDVIRNVQFVGDMMWERQSGLDHWGVGWKYELAEYLPMVAECPIKCPSDIDHYRPPEPVFRLAPGSVAMLDTIDRSQFLLSGFHPNLVFERAWFLMGMDCFLELTATDPARAQRLVRMIGDYQVAMAEQYARYYIELVFAGDDYGTQRALMMSPARWRELIKPEIARILAVYKKAGKWVRFHSCGHITEILDDLIEIGVDIINPCQARANDLAEWGRRFTGRVTFDGGVDTQYTMMLGSQEEVRLETLLRMAQLGGEPRGGLLLWADQNMPFPEENRRVLRETIIEFGKYPLKEQVIR